MSLHRINQQKLKRYIGDRTFYKAVLIISVPIMIQNGITNFVGLLDKIMIGRVGTEQMSGASVVNQLLFVYNLCIFGAISGAGIFTAQFYGQKDEKGIRDTFRYKLVISVILTAGAIALFLLWGEELVSLYLSGDGTAQAREATLRYGVTYLNIMLAGLPAFFLAQCYAGTLRECGETVLPMNAGLLAVFVNLALNYLLIYGKLGFPRWGVAGAAVATVISRYVECGIIMIVAHRKKTEYPYLTGLYRTLRIPGILWRKILLKGTPLMVNEAMWSAGMAMLFQCYSVLGLNVVAATNISNTIFNVFSIVFIALGNAVAIIVGQLLGAGDMEEAQDTAAKLIVFSVAACLVVTAVMYPLAPFFPRIYNTDKSVRDIAAALIRIMAVFMPVSAFLNSCYFTLRAGGKTIITFLFDSVFVWLVSVPAAFFLTRYTGWDIRQVYFAVTSLDLIKCLLGYILVKKGVWLVRIT